MSNFDSVISRIRQALTSGPTEQPAAAAGAPAQAGVARGSNPDELRARFIAALIAVGGNAIEAASHGDAIQKIEELLFTRGLHSAAIGEGITTDSGPAAARLTQCGFQVVRIGPQDGSQAGLKQILSRVDAGIVEADYAIASTGTVVMIGNPARPRSLSLLPPLNIVLLQSSRILPDLAAVLRIVGPQTITEHPMVLVTGPSRTADIEKRIVIGVHGPKELHVVVIPDDAQNSSVTQ